MTITPIPKPRREDRKRVNVETRELALPKRHFERDATYRAWVRTHRCLLHWFSRCDGKVEASHLQRGGMAEKGSDYSCIPLCGLRHHKLLDGNSLDHEILAFLWMKCWELREDWRRRSA